MPHGSSSVSILPFVRWRSKGNKNCPAITITRDLLSRSAQTLDLMSSNRTPQGKTFSLSSRQLYERRSEKNCSAFKVNTNHLDKGTISWHIRRRAKVKTDDLNLNENPSQRVLWVSRSCNRSSVGLAVLPQAKGGASCRLKSIHESAVSPVDPRRTAADI